MHISRETHMIYLILGAMYYKESKLNTYMDGTFLVLWSSKRQNQNYNATLMYLIVKDTAQCLTGKTSYPQANQISL